MDLEKLNPLKEMKFTFRMLVICVLLITACSWPTGHDEISRLKVSENNRFLVKDDGNPFFWLGDTGWLLFKNLNREDALIFLDDRNQ